VNIVARGKYNITTITKFPYGNQQSSKIYGRNIEGTTISRTFKTDFATTSTLQTPAENTQQHLLLLSHDWYAMIVPYIWQCYSEPICYMHSSAPLQSRCLSL